MKLGLGLDKEIITTYTSNAYPDLEARELYPCVVAHKTLPYICCSPDAIIARENKRNLPIVAKRVFANLKAASDFGRTAG